MRQESQVNELLGLWQQIAVSWAVCCTKFETEWAPVSGGLNCKYLIHRPQLCVFETSALAGVRVLLDAMMPCVYWMGSLKLGCAQEMFPTHQSHNLSLNWLSYTSSQCPRSVNNMYQVLRLSRCPGRSRDMRPWAHNTVVSMPSTCGLTSWGSRNNLDVGQHWQPVSSSCCWCPANGPPEKNNT